MRSKYFIFVQNKCVYVLKNILRNVQFGSREVSLSIKNKKQIYYIKYVMRDSFFIRQCVHTVYRVHHVYTVCIVWYTVCSVCWGLWVVWPLFKTLLKKGSLCMYCMLGVVGRVTFFQTRLKKVYCVLYVEGFGLKRGCIIWQLSEFHPTIIIRVS